MSRLVGACPGPALANLGTGNLPPIIYCASLFVGMWLSQAQDHVLQLRAADRAHAHTTPTPLPTQELPSTAKDTTADGEGRVLLIDEAVGDPIIEKI